MDALQVLQNIGLLALSGLAVQPLLQSRWTGRARVPLLRQVALGAILGAAALIVSSRPVELSVGAVVDGRAGPLALAGYLGGPCAGLAAAALGVVARWFHGGPFLVAGVASYFSYAVLGTLAGEWWLRRTGERELRAREIALLSLTPVIAAAISWALLPADSAATWLRTTAVLGILSSMSSIWVTAAALRLVIDSVRQRQVAGELTERLELATAAAGIGVWDFDPRTNALQWSDEMFRLFQTDPSTFRGHYDDWADAVHPDDLEPVSAQLVESIERDEYFDSEFRIVTDQGIRFLKGRAVVERDEQGQAVRVLGVNFDLSLVRRYEEEVAKGRRSLEKIAEAVPGVILRFVVDRQGRHRIEYLSRRSEDVWELPPEEVGADMRRLRAMMSRSDQRRFRDAVAASLTTREAFVVEFAVTTPSGRRKMLQAWTNPYGGSDGDTVYNVVVLDVTEQSQVREKLAESQRLFHESQRLEAVGKLTGGVAHDFNNLLAVLQGTLDLLRQNATPEDLLLIEDSLAAAQRGAKLTSQLLAFGRRAPMRPEVLDLNERIDEFTRLLRRTLPANIEIRIVQEEQLWRVELDASLLESALLNLALNARDALADEAGRLTLRTSNLVVEERPVFLRDGGDVPSGQYVCVEVSDSGSGMAPEVLHNAFEPFFTTKESGVGSGMGLPMVQGFVQQSRGALRVESAPGRGTQIQLIFPRFLGEMPERDASGGRPCGPEGGAEHVLLVEDDPGVRRVTEQQLRRLGYRVTVASNGVSGLETARRDPSIDLLLTDVVMPGPLQGPQMLREIRAVRPELPAVLVSGYSAPAAMREFEFGSRDVLLSKPVQASVLARTLRGLLDSVPRERC